MKSFVIYITLAITLSVSKAQQPLPAFTTQFDSNRPTYDAGGNVLTNARLLRLFECEHYAMSQGVDVPGNHWQHKETFDSSLPVGCSVSGYVNGLSPNDPLQLMFFYNTPPASVTSATGECCEGACGEADTCIYTVSPVISPLDAWVIDPEAANDLNEDYWSGKSTDCLVQGTEAQPKYALLKSGTLSCTLCGRAEFFAEYSRDNYFLDTTGLPPIQRVARHSPCCVNSHHKVCQRMLEEYKLRCDMHDKGAGGTCTADINVVHVINSDITGNPETASKTQCETYAQNSGLDHDDAMETVNTDTIPRGCVYVHEVDNTKEIKYNEKSNSMMQCSTTNECLTWAFDRTLA